MRYEKIIWIVIFILGFGVRSTDVFHPMDTGTWRENDESSIARNYYRNGMDFLHPQIDWGGNGPGYVESEFPVYPYLMALSYKLFGFWEPTGRIISFLLSLGTMLVFFRLSRYLFNQRTAIAASCFFALSPLLMIISNSIQPESLMFFFYILAAFYFIRWIDNESGKNYILAFVFTALTLLCKITAINIGILFTLTILIKKGWRYAFKPKVILLAILTVAPAFTWYQYAHRFYLLYGNSLGLSNEYPWVGWDFFTNHYFLKGIITQELVHVWSYSGLFIFLLALVSTKLIRRQYLIFPVCWLLAVGIFYVIAARTTADNWAYYYHIFSVPSASMLMGISVIEIYDRYFPVKLTEIKQRGLVIACSFLLLLFLAGYNLRYVIHTKSPVYKTSAFYECKNSLSDLIPDGSLILATGGVCADNDNYPVAYNASYFFYWLDRKGYNLCIGDQSIENVEAFKLKGVKYYIAEVIAMEQTKGFEDIMRKTFKIEMECNGIVLFKL
jgi:hypothetical protein